VLHETTDLVLPQLSLLSRKGQMKRKGASSITEWHTSLGALSRIADE
jgi:hypothetical protein